jgi:hypothetical protein
MLAIPYIKNLDHVVMIDSRVVVLFFIRFTHFFAVVLLFVSMHHTHGTEFRSLPSDSAPGRRIVLGLRRTVLRLRD